MSSSNKENPTHSGLQNIEISFSCNRTVMSGSDGQDRSAGCSHSRPRLLPPYCSSIFYNTKEARYLPIQKESRGGLFNVLISRPRHIASAHILLTRTWPSNCRGAGKCSPAKRPGLNHNSIFMTEGENRFGQIISLATLTKLPDIIIVIQVTKLN